MFLLRLAIPLPRCPISLPFQMLPRLTLDVFKLTDIEAAVEVVKKQTGGTLDYLINNAGRNHFKPILDEDSDAVRNLFEINFYGPLALTQAFVPLLIKAKGMAVYITSIAGYCNVPFMGRCSIQLTTESLTACFSKVLTCNFDPLRNILSFQEIPGNCGRNLAIRTGSFWR